MIEYLQPDICVIGGGSAGLRVAIGAAQAGGSVILIERDRLGGESIHAGSVPAKALIAAGKRAQDMRTAPKFGIQAQEPTITFDQVNDHVKQVVADIGSDFSLARFRGMGIDIIEEEAAFVDTKTVRAGYVHVRARRFVIATGSRALVPPIPGLPDFAFLNEKTILALRHKPGELVVIGGGPTAMELAQAHQRLGCNVTVLAMADPLAEHDAELRAIVMNHLRGEGVDIRAPIQISQIIGKDRSVTVQIEAPDGTTENIIGTHLLIAAGRAPNTERLALEKANIRFDRTGIAVNHGLRTSNPVIYAIGDVTGEPHLAHAAAYQADLVVRNAMYGLPVRQNKNSIPCVTFTDPAIAHVGLREDQLRKLRGTKYRILRWSFQENDRARIEHSGDGHLKVLTGRRGKILGASAVGLHAEELISLYAFAIANGMGISAFGKMAAPYPTLSEVAKHISDQYFRDRSDSPVMNGIAKINRLFD